MKEYIDSTVFMGMHSIDENIRIACKNFFVGRLSKTIYMSFENVGECDNKVWQFDRKTQDAYYPFMDWLHSLMKIRRMPYKEIDLKNIEKLNLKSLTLKQRLTISMVFSAKGRLYTFDKKILGLKLNFITCPYFSGKELEFPNELEKWYQKSLKLRIL